MVAVGRLDPKGDQNVENRFAATISGRGAAWRGRPRSPDPPPPLSSPLGLFKGVAEGLLPRSAPLRRFAPSPARPLARARTLRSLGQLIDVGGAAQPAGAAAEEASYSHCAAACSAVRVSRAVPRGITPLRRSDMGGGFKLTAPCRLSYVNRC